MADIGQSVRAVVDLPGPDVVSVTGGVIIGGRGMVGLGCAGRRSVGICGGEERFSGGRGVRSTP